MIQADCSLTQTQYRQFMHYHVLGRKGDVIRHAILCLLFAAFGILNFVAGSPILGWIFVLLGIYFLLTRYLRFFMSVDRIIKQYGLGDEPKFFYQITFREQDFKVRNATETAAYPWDRIHMAVIAPDRQMIYLYVTTANAFLIPASGLAGTDLAGAGAFLAGKLPDQKILHI